MNVWVMQLLGGKGESTGENGKRIGKMLIRISTELDVTSWGNCSELGGGEAEGSGEGMQCCLRNYVFSDIRF